jgi:GNAT superfamily N-acetyltransferase
VTTIVLSDGSAADLRPITPGDARAMRELHSRMSARTRYLRFFTPYPHLQPAHLRRFVTVDHHDREALVVAAGPRIVAVGRYERVAPGSPDAEVALVVEDAYQRRGAGSALLTHLAAAARANGITRFVGLVLPENRALLRLIDASGYQVRRRFADGLVHVGFPLPDA